MYRFFILSLLFVYQHLAWANYDSTSQVSSFAIPNSSVYEIKSEKLSRTYSIFVAVPKGYSKTAKTKYPMVIVNDGPYAFPLAASSLSVPMSAGVLEKVILVGIGYSKGDNMMHSRIRDYTPSTDANWRAFKPGQAQQYLSFIESELLPFIEARYSIDQNKRTLVGHSAGGLFASYVLLNKPDLFESYVVLSGAFFWDKRLLFKQEREYAKNHDDLAARVYFAVGTHETSKRYPFQWLEDQTEFVKQLSARRYANLNIKQDVIEEGLHETTFPIGFMRAMQWLYAR
ncbi:alpha/beta hydrolase [Pseudoalteromonas luteoviolacea]|uniref:Putative hydrolase of the alpha/beta superfamily n=1 Tax=Pseudoalteromonas luteoviolacea (strain 2ta16) TaxID=1353533 RepID=V4HPJ7_PSEL2|nr:alpha/beta hydrolase-fold protein [Pseudoalteromonas luteoviolacea]ESP92740.1 putative hydrolase of the alpha/beta superfamily [Pseudoalteromonas luteoviolacea 2ta16]KZN35550.1 hypothetical protein N483_00930 [Pseudoalteromonas luteoviolacea NCIMB 1944]